MISVLYPVTDYDAADIALKVQALTSNNGSDVYVVPKHYGRNREQVFRNLLKSSQAFFLSTKNSVVDKETIDELRFLLERGKTISAIVPNTMASRLPTNNKMVVYPFKNTKNAIVNDMTRIIEEIKEKEKNTSAILLIGLAALLMALASSKK